MPDGASGSKVALDLYRSFAARSRVTESMYGIYTGENVGRAGQPDETTHIHQKFSRDGFVITHGNGRMSLVRLLVDRDKRRRFV